MRVISLPRAPRDARRRPFLTLIAALALLPVASCSSILGGWTVPPQGMPASPDPEITAQADARLLEPENTPDWVGAVFPTGSDQNVCTGDVLDSPGGDLVLTAAHCVVGTGEGMTFVPGYGPGRAPFGRWRVTAAYVDDAWRRGTSQMDDFAILRVVPETDPSDDGGSDASGNDSGGRDADGRTADGSAADGRAAMTLPAGLPLGEDPEEGTSVTVVSFPAGEDDALICTTTTGIRETEIGSVATFPCDGYVGGTSGSAWVEDIEDDPRIVGLIGGYHLGGCRTVVSYTSPISRLAELLADVEAGMEPSDVPPVQDDGCGD